ncbi:hypothetical protein [Chondromyces apiculatus]|nr:hypothetical protein [Chondromyces apiculatus]
MSHHPRPRRSRAHRCAALSAALFSCAALTLSAGDAAAQAPDFSTRMTARKLADEALKLFDQKDYAAALDKFDIANQLTPAPTLAVRSARCLVQLGRLVEASERYLDVVRMKVPANAPFQHKKAQVEALDEREQLLPKIPSLLLNLDGPLGKGVEVSLDGKPFPAALLGQKQPLDPGKHEIAAVRKDYTLRRSIDLREGQQETLTLKFPPLPVVARSLEPPPPERSTYRTLGWVGVGAGGGLLLLGAANGVAALIQRGALLDDCPEQRCLPEQHGAADLYDVTRVITSAGLIGGAVLGAAGVTLLVLDLDHPASPAPPAPDAARDAARHPPLRLGVSVDWGGATVRGIF